MRRKYYYLLQHRHKHVCRHHTPNVTTLDISKVATRLTDCALRFSKWTFSLGIHGFSLAYYATSRVTLRMRTRNSTMPPPIQIVRILRYANWYWRFMEIKRIFILFIDFRTRFIGLWIPICLYTCGGLWTRRVRQHGTECRLLNTIPLQLSTFIQSSCGAGLDTRIMMLLNGKNTPGIWLQWPRTDAQNIRR